MRYAIVVILRHQKQSPHSKKMIDIITRVKKEDYSTHEKALRKIEESYKKLETIVIPLPEKFEVGLIVYKSDGTPYAQMFNISRSAYHFKRFGKGEDDDVGFLIDSFEQKFIDEIIFAIGQVKEELI